MGISKEQALDCLRSPDLIGIGMEADAVRRHLHPENVVSYAVDYHIPATANLSADSALEGLSSFSGDDLTHALELHRRTHLAGTRTSAVMVFGGGESLDDRVERLFAIRALQEETGGFMAFDPRSFMPSAGAIEAPTAVEYMRTLAVARMVLDNIENVESSCLAQGLKVTQMALRFGANDAGTIHAEGMKSFTEQDLRRVIRDAGFQPVERDTLYQTMFLNN